VTVLVITLDTETVELISERLKESYGEGSIADQVNALINDIKGRQANAEMVDEFYQELKNRPKKRRRK
jgi:hypothetical protein